MKNSTKFLAMLVLGASALFNQSCKEVEEEPTPPADPTCYMLTSNMDGELTTYTYNASNQLVSAERSGTTTTFTYTDGKLMGANDGYTQSTFVYTGAETQPSRVNLKEDNVDAGYIIMEYENGLITKTEFHDETGQITTVNYTTYDANGNLTGLQFDEWDSDSEEFVTFVTFTGMTNDGKKNPFQTSLALIYSNIEEAVVFGKTNITGGNLVVFGQSVPFTATNTYNSNNYATSTVINVFGETTTYEYTFDCK
jgi:YD repeat-containing protein